WQTAADGDGDVSEGWLGRYFANCCAGADPTVGIAIGEEMPQAFAAKSPTGITFSQPEEFRWRPSEEVKGRMSAEEFFFRQLNGSSSGQELAASEGGSVGAISGKSRSDLSTIDFLTRTALDAQLSSDKILAVALKYKSNIPYPNGRLATSLRMIARLIGGGLPTRVY